MKKDIATREDLYVVVESFYEKLLRDPLLFPFFIKFREAKYLKEHLNVLVDFWDNILFYSGTYTKNAMQPHLKLNAIRPIEKKHFERWIEHFNSAVDARFEGENAHAVKSRALSIATVMQIKVSENE